MTLNDFEARQILLMKETIEDYQQDKLDIDNLIFNLTSLANFFEEKDPVWHERFLEFWGTLEILNSLRIVSNKTDFSQEAKQKIDEALNNLSNYSPRNNQSSQNAGNFPLKSIFSASVGHS